MVQIESIDTMSKKEKTEKDVKMDQDGKMINPHNPEFITKVPWYLGNSGMPYWVDCHWDCRNEWISSESLGPTLKHHSIQKRDHFLSITESDELIVKKIETQKVQKSNSWINLLINS